MNKDAAEYEQMKFIFEEKLISKEKELAAIKQMKEATENEATKVKTVKLVALTCASVLEALKILRADFTTILGFR